VASEPSGKWDMPEGATDYTGHTVSPFPPPSCSFRWYRPDKGPRGRVCCSLGGFSLLAFAFLILLLKSIHVSSEEVAVSLPKGQNEENIINVPKKIQEL